MDRTFLFLVVLALVGTAGFYLGRQTQPVQTVVVQRPPVEERARAPVAVPAPPNVSPAPPVQATAPPTVQTPTPPLEISLPLRGLQASDIHDMFNDLRGGTRQHQATDIMAPRGTSILAVNDGRIVKLFLSKPGGNTIYQFDPTEQYCYYYAHLDRYADGISEGALVRRGDTIGYVGSTGDANPSAPHLHFEIHQLDPEKRWWKGTPVNPYPYLVDALRRGE